MNARAADSGSHRFVPTAGGLMDLFRRYEEERVAGRHIGSAATRVAKPTGGYGRHHTRAERYGRVAAGRRRKRQATVAALPDAGAGRDRGIRRRPRFRARQRPAGHLRAADRPAARGTANAVRAIHATAGEAQPAATAGVAASGSPEKAERLRFALASLARAVAGGSGSSSLIALGVAWPMGLGAAVDKWWNGDAPLA